MKRYPKLAAHRLRLVKVATLAAFVITAGSCDGGLLFEKTNVDPHPPRLLNFQFAPSSIETGDEISGSYTFVDDGGDVVSFNIRDTSGLTTFDPTLPSTIEVDAEGEATEIPGESIVMLGTVGTIEWETPFETNTQGRHLVKVWLEDSKGSLSNIVEFEVAVSPVGGTP